MLRAWMTCWWKCLAFCIWKQVALTHLIRLSVKLQQRAVMVEMWKAIKLTWTMQATCLHLDTCHWKLLTSHCWWKKKTIMHLKTKLQTHTSLTWAKAIMNWCKLKKCKSWCIITWMQEWACWKQIIKCLVELWTMSTKTTKKLWLLKLEKWSCLLWCEMCWSMMTWCWSLTLMQKLTIILTEQLACETETLYS